MEKVIFTNKRGESIEIEDRPPFIFKKIGGTDGTNTTVHTQKSPDQHGSTYLNTTLENKDLSLELVILCENEEEIFMRRREITKIFNPLLKEGNLKYIFPGGEREINVIIERGPVFNDDESLPVEQLPCLIQLLAPKPFWRDIVESKKEIALWKGDFSFPLEITSDEIEMGHREPSLIVNVLNNGDIKCGMKIEFKALATVVNPSLFNVNTREYIKINKTMSPGEVIFVSTHFGDKRVESRLNGITSDALNDFDILNSTFAQLDVGDNLFRYDAEQNVDNLEVNIYYTPQYLGV